MQIQKDIVREHILIAANKLFLNKDFMSVSMRDISKESQVGLSNIYNYFKNKDDIFRVIVQPSVAKLMGLYKKHHSQDSVDIVSMTSESYFEDYANEHISLITTNSQSYILLLFKSQGSSFERFKDEFVDFATQYSKQYFLGMKRKYPEVNENSSELFIRTSIYGMFNLFEELLIFIIKGKDIKPIVKEYMRCNIAGMRELMKV